MIQITREGKTVKIQAKYGINGWYSEFVNTANCELDAILRERKLRENLFNTIEGIRRDAYEAGWKDKSDKKKAKQNWFSGNM